VNQGAVNKKGRRIRLCAWGVSIFAHAVVLSAFGVLRFSYQGADVQQAGAVVGISQAGQLLRLPAVVPKPKVVSGRRTVIRKGEFEQVVNIRPDLESPKQDLQPPILTEKNTQVYPGGFAGGRITTAQAEFFGSIARGRRVCYVVDCSGSMQGLWHRVRGELIESIGRIEPDQYFCVIAFGADSIMESGGGRMVRATERAKKDAYSFVDSLRPAGTTNALAALQQAVKIRDDENYGPSVIYFLTDGFELSEQDGSRFAHQIMTMLRSFSPKTQINTIGFWPGEQDRRTLERIAGESGGEFVVVNDGAGPEAMTDRR